MKTAALRPSIWQAQLRDDPAALRGLLGAATAAFRSGSNDGRSRFEWRGAWFVAHGNAVRLLVDDDCGAPIAERFWR